MLKKEDIDIVPGDLIQITEDFDDDLLNMFNLNINDILLVIKIELVTSDKYMIIDIFVTNGMKNFCIPLYLSDIGVEIKKIA